MRLLLMGSRPPPLGGTTLLFDQLTRELSDRPDVDLRVVDTSRGPRESTVALAWRLGTHLVRGALRADVVTLHASPPGLAVFGALARCVCGVARVPFVVRVFGGSLDQELAAMPRLARALLGLALGADRVLVETEAVRAHFAKVRPSMRAAAHANSRPIPDEIPVRAGPGARRFVFVGHVRPSKGIRELLEASDRLDGAGARLDVIGPLSDGVEETELEAHAAARWLGALAPGRVQQELATADALVLPTYHSGEGHPGALLEAFAAGIPVVASDFRAIPEVVSHEVNGLLVEPRNAEALAEAMLRLARDGALWERLASGARESARQFDSLAATARFVDTCREVVRERGPSR